MFGSVFAILAYVFVVDTPVRTLALAGAVSDGPAVLAYQIRRVIASDPITGMHACIMSGIIIAYMGQVSHTDNIYIPYRHTIDLYMLPLAMQSIVLLVVVFACVFFILAMVAVAVLYGAGSRVMILAAKIVCALIFIAILAIITVVIVSRIISETSAPLALASSITHNMLHVNAMQKMVEQPVTPTIVASTTTTHTTATPPVALSIVVDDDPLDEFPIASRRTFRLVVSGATSEDIVAQLTDAVPVDMAVGLSARAVSGDAGCMHDASYQMGGDVCVYHAQWRPHHADSTYRLGVVGTCITIAEEVVGEKRTQDYVLTGAVHRSCVAGSWFYCSEKAETAMRESVEPNWAPKALTSSQQSRLLASLHETTQSLPALEPVSDMNPDGLRIAAYEYE